MNKSQANISVIIPAYNRANLIGQTLRSLLNQTVPAKEIIVVDDGSTDGTAEVVEQIAEEIEDRRSKIGDAAEPQRTERRLAPEDRRSKIGDWGQQGSLNSRPSPLDAAAVPQIRVIRQQNAGPGAARNRGLSEATGEFIHFFDSDDIAAPNKHEVQLNALLESGADIAYGPWVKGRFAAGDRRSEIGDRMSDDGDRRSEARHQRSENAMALDAGRWSLVSGLWSFKPEGPVLQARGLPDGDLVRALLTDWSVVPHACLFRRSILERVGGFPEDMWVGEDQLLFLRCLLAGAKVVHTPGTMVFYRLGDEGKLTESREGQRRRVVDWGRFLLSAKKEIEDRRSDQKSAVRSRRSENGPVEYPADSTGERGLIAEDGDRRSEIGNGVGTTNHTNHTNFLTTIEHRGRCEMEQPEVGPKGERAGANESNEHEKVQPLITQIDTDKNREAGPRPGSRAGAAFSNPSTSELARDSENTSLNRSAIGTASALRADEDRRSETGDREEIGELVHKLAGGEGSGSTSPGRIAPEDRRSEIGDRESSGAKPELPVCEQGRDGEPLGGGCGTEQPRQWGVPRKHIEDGPKGAASGERARQSPSLQSGTMALDTAPSWFGFRLRAYEAWRDLRVFFPGEYFDLERGLEVIWKQSRFSFFGFHFSGFLLRKFGGLRQRIIGHRWPGSFRCETATKNALEALMKSGGDSAEGGGRRTDC